MIDVGDPATPLRLPDLDPSFGWVMAVGDGLMVSLPPGSAATGYRLPLAVSELADPSHPRRVGTMAISGYLASLDPTTSFALVATIVGMCPEVAVVDLAKLAAPLLRGRWAPDLNPSVIVSRGQRAYVGTDDMECDVGEAHRGSLSVLDVSELDHPAALGSIQLNRPVHGLAVADSLAFVAVWDQGLYIVDVSNPPTLTVVGQLMTPGLATDVAIDGDRAYVAFHDPSQQDPDTPYRQWRDRWGGVLVVDVSDASAPRIIGRLATGSPGRLAVHGGTLWVASAESGLWAWHHPLPESSGAEMLRYFMAEHALTQAEVPEVGSQGVVSEVLSGKRNLNVRQIRALAARFHVSPAVFV